VYIKLSSGGGGPLQPSADAPDGPAGGSSSGGKFKGVKKLFKPLKRLSTTLGGAGKLPRPSGAAAAEPGPPDSRSAASQPFGAAEGARERTLGGLMQPGLAGLVADAGLVSEAARHGAVALLRVDGEAGAGGGGNGERGWLLGAKSFRRGNRPTEPAAAAGLGGGGGGGSAFARVVRRACEQQRLSRLRALFATMQVRGGQGVRWEW
jgi:hypothetical protein